MNHGPSRSSARRLRAAEQASAERDRRAGRLVAAAAVVVPAFTVGALVLAGLSPLPRGAEAGAASETGPEGRVVGAQAPPAQDVVDRLMAASIPGWSALGPPVPAATDPLVEGCDRGEAPAPALTASRRFDASGRVVGLRVEVYGAGLGAVALRDTLASYDTCGTSTSSPPSAIGLDAALALRPASDGRPSVGALRWRRGDVVVALSVAGSGSGLAALARDVDRELLRSLDGRCAEIGSELADAARSPYSPTIGFTGLVSPVLVAVPPLEDPGAGLGSPSPAPTVSYPVRPADPIEPTALPTPVPAPTLPADPGPQPTEASIPSRGPDPVGPGCGWGFVGQTAPSFDAAAEAAKAEAAADQARADLIARQQVWADQRAGTLVQYSAYEAQLAAFVQYAAEVARIAGIWDAVSAARAAYDQALAAYLAALAARQQWLLDRDAAAQAYDDAVAACDAGDPVVDPTPGPGISASPEPTPTQDQPGCPPEVPAILFEEPPPVPASPAPLG